jgi:hypothetical protein
MAGFFYAQAHPVERSPAGRPPSPTPPNPNLVPYSGYSTLLGKLSDVGAFTEKSEITVTHKTSDDLRKAIQDKIQRLLDMDVIDVEAKSLEEELGIDESTATTGTAEQTPQST